MKPHKRLWLLFVLILVSAGYSVLVKKDPDLANFLALLYVAFLLTLLTINHVGRPR